MDYFLEGLREATRLVLTLDPEVLGIALLSLAVSGSATVAAALVGVPMGAFLANRKGRAARATSFLLRGGMAFPSVLMGLLLYGLLSRRGPLGPMDLLFTPTAMALGQFLLALPLVTALCEGAVSEVDPRIGEAARTLGAREWTVMLVTLRQARGPIILAIVAGFSRVITEVGCAIIVGGNLKDRTRILTTAVTLEARRGEFGAALAMGLILLALALAVNLAISGRRTPGPMAC